MQTTLSHSIRCEGTALHSGENVAVEIRPAAANTGLVFHIHTEGGVRVLPQSSVTERQSFVKENGVHIVPLSPSAVSTTELATTVSDGEVSVSTIEHVLSACAGMGLDNAEIHAFQNEVPLLDGSALQVARRIMETGLVSQDFPRNVAYIAEETTFAAGIKSIQAKPSDKFFVDYTIRFPHPVIGEQRFALEVNPESFLREIAPARTFGFIKDVEYLHAKGLARGASLDNVVAVGDNGVVNEGGLRFSDEFVRHKILDFIGDMAMLGLPLRGAFIVVCSGHAHNNAFLRSVTQNKGLEMRTEG